MTDKEVFENIMNWAYQKGGDWRELHSQYYLVEGDHNRKFISKFFLKMRLILEFGFIVNLSPSLLSKIGLDGTGQIKNRKIKNLIDTLNRDRKRVSYLGEIP